MHARTGNEYTEIRLLILKILGIFSHDRYKKRPLHAFMASTSKMAAVVLTLELKCQKQLLV